MHTHIPPYLTYFTSTERVSFRRISLCSALPATISEDFQCANSVYKILWIFIVKLFASFAFSFFVCVGRRVNRFFHTSSAFFLRRSLVWLWVGSGNEGSFRVLKALMNIERGWFCCKFRRERESEAKKVKSSWRNSAEKEKFFAFSAPSRQLRRENEWSRRAESGSTARSESIKATVFGESIFRGAGTWRNRKFIPSAQGRITKARKTSEIVDLIDLPIDERENLLKNK